MNIENVTVWQHGCVNTDTGMDFSDLCFECDVILLGPGGGGPYPDCIKGLENHEYWKNHINKLKSRLEYIRVFYEDMNIEDIVVLRRGRTDVLGVGIIVGGYQWHEMFGNVDGWDLQHYRRVRWLWTWIADGNVKVFPPNTLAGEVSAELHSPLVRDWLNRLTITDAQWKRPLADLHT